jgi:hypothetical protein
MKSLLIGIDFDNTVVCYDTLFHQVALEMGEIVPEVPVAKEAVRDYLRAQGREERWTWMQGYVYGARILEAPPFPGVVEFIRDMVLTGIPLCIISHKTVTPYAGEPYDLHQAARSWLENYLIVGDHAGGLSRDKVYFLPTKAQKLARIGEVGCSHFIDDLPEFLAEADFPQGVEKLLFDPANSQHSSGKGDADVTSFRSWREIAGYFRAKLP